MIRTALPLSMLLLAFGCNGDEKADDSATTSKCETTVTTYPSSGATDHYYMDPIEFYLSEPDASATVSGIDGSTSVSEDGKTITFTPTSLAPATSYTVTLDYCAGTVELSFTTSALGTEVSDPNSLVGNTYNVNLADANIVSPAGVGSILGSVLTTPILLGVTEVGATMEMLGAIGVEGGTTQDYCTPSIDFPTATFDNPSFAVGPQDTTIDVAGATIPIGQLAVTGTFAADGSYFGGGTLSGSLDARDIAAALPDLGYDAQGLCDLLVSFGAACAGCDDGETLCLEIVANRITADKVDGTLVEVTGSDCPGCDAGEPVCE